MALDYSITYPGKSAAPDANYPQGSARNVTVSGDGTGFPADYQWFNDFAGFFQRMLLEGGVTPSGAADTVLASDYFDALDALITGTGLPVASTTVAGITAYATSAETITGTEAAKATTAAGVQAKAASVGETIAGTSTTKFLTPAGLNGRTATDARTGIVELATAAETIAGTDPARAVTPAGLAAAATSAWVEPTLDSPWANESGQEVQYRKINFGTCVQIIGRASTASGTPARVFTLPSGFRPPFEIYSTCAEGVLETAKVVDFMRVEADGDVFVPTATTIGTYDFNIIIPIT